MGELQVRQEDDHDLGDYRMKYSQDAACTGTPCKLYHMIKSSLGKDLKTLTAIRAACGRLWGETTLVSCGTTFGVIKGVKNVEINIWSKGELVLHECYIASYLVRIIALI